jgi:hypothetical protein
MAIINAGNDLLSHTLSRAVQSALRGLTSVFGMGTGGTPAVKSPTSLAAFSCQLSAVSFALLVHVSMLIPQLRGAASLRRLRGV